MNDLDRRRPFARSYWVVPGKLLAGAYPGSPDPAEMQWKLEALLDSSVDTVLSLMEEGEGGAGGLPLQRYEPILVRLAAGRGVIVECRRHPIRDVDVTTREHMGAILDDMDAAIAAGRRVYVHCFGGRGRTGTVVGCWLVRHGFVAGVAAVGAIHRLRAEVPDAEFPSPDTAAQRRMVETWREQGLPHRSISLLGTP